MQNCLSQSFVDLIIVKIVPVVRAQCTGNVVVPRVLHGDTRDAQSPSDWRCMMEPIFYKYCQVQCLAGFFLRHTADAHELIQW